MQPRLKSLELHGYKTFASRTNFSFPGVITAIVGPNGSGKSNIADAIRWVLGEQSFSLLRGRKTEDMIFSGSEQRSRAGMASATITFDNEDGWLPIDFSEVAITRRAYRDGQNEYLINGQRVRLREISELLAQSGLAERTYTIIGQGLVDAALALKPEERRRLFEEAAGIGLYRSRREEAISRLESTNRNLERVQDIIAELEPRVKSLERQAKRAQEYEHLRADLHELLREWYGYNWLQTQREIKRTAEILRHQEKHLEEAYQKRSAALEEISGVRRQINEARAKLNAWHAQAADVHQQLERTSRSMAILDERKRSIIEQEISLRTDLTRVEGEINDRQNRLQASQAEKSKLQSDLDDNLNQESRSAEELQARLHERSAVESRLAGERQALVRLETNLVKQNARKAELEERLAGLHASISAVDHASANTQAEAERLQAHLKEVQTIRDRAELEKRQDAQTLETARSELAVLEEQRRSIQENSNHFEQDAARLEAQLEVLENAEKSLTRLSEGAKFVLEFHRRKNTQTKMQALSTILDVPPELEVAITAALGEYLDLILMDQSQDPDQILSILQSDDHGRAALLPEKWARTPAEIILPVDKDCLGIASELVTAPAEILPLVKAILGETLVVRDRTAARRVLEGRPRSMQAVTLQGELFLQNGAVVSGMKDQAGSGHLNRPRLIRDMRKELQALNSKKNESSLLQESNAQEIQSAQKSLQERAAMERKSMAEADKAGNNLRGLENQVEQNRRQLEWHQDQKRQALERVSTLETEILRLSASLVEAEAEIQKARTSLQIVTQNLADLPVDELRIQAAHWETSVTVSRQAYQVEERRHAELQADLERAENNATAVRERIEANLNNLSASKIESEQHRLEESRLKIEVDKINTAAAPAEAELVEFEKNLESLETDDLSSQQQLTVAERQHNQAQLEAIKARDNAESIRRKAEDDFGLVSFSGEDAVTGQEPLPLEGMVEQLPPLEELPAGLEETISRIRLQIRRMGAINPEALVEFTEVQTRHLFMKNQVEDLTKAEEDLNQVISELDELMKREFRKTFDAVAGEFKGMFTRLFGGGYARLVLTDDEQPIEAGIEIEARLPGRREQGLSLLSGGERSLAAVALVFSLLKVSPTPFCVLDEVDAMLDEANVGRFRDLMRELSETTQFIVITHNRNTVQAADVIYGVTMGRDSASQVISLKLEEVPQEMAQ